MAPSSTAGDIFGSCLFGGSGKVGIFGCGKLGCGIFDCGTLSGGGINDGGGRLPCRCNSSSAKRSIWRCVASMTHWRYSSMAPKHLQDCCGCFWRQRSNNCATLTHGWLVSSTKWRFVCSTKRSNSCRMASGDLWWSSCYEHMSISPLMSPITHMRCISSTALSTVVFLHVVNIVFWLRISACDSSMGVESPDLSTIFSNTSSGT